jgi:hypothetical protein
VLRGLQSSEVLFAELRSASLRPSARYPVNYDLDNPWGILLPHDAITGEPFKYRRTDGSHFVLYSLGWNGKDDGGLPGNVPFDEKRGDWIWSYQAE